jgi:DUF4097 and DUF4098 domain-containing protein YvlB
MHHRFASSPWLAALAMAVAIPVRAAEPQQFDRQLTVTGPVTLEASSGSGDIAVRVGGDGTVKIVGRVRPNESWGISTADAEAAVRAILASPPIVQSGNTIHVGEITDRDLARRVSISFDITTPAQTTASVRTGSGDISVADLRGAVSANTGSGSVNVGRSGGTVQVRTGSGDIVVAGARGSADVTTGSGDVRIDDVAGSANVRSGSGDISVHQSAAGAVDLSSGSGDLSLSGASGPVQAKAASGDVSVAGTPTADWTVNTASGSVSLMIPEGANFRVAVSSSSGSITNGHPSNTTLTSRRDLQATVGSGGPLVSVRSASGSVEIKKAAAK